MSETVDAIRKRLPQALLEVAAYQGETTLKVEPRHLLGVLRLLKEERGFDSLADITAVHWPDEGLIDALWIVRSMATREQFRVKVRLPQEAPVTDSVTGLWGTADWLEREVYDLMGVRFEGHPDLTRILLPEEFDGHPLRKEYPMEGDDEWRNYLPVEEK